MSTIARYEDSLKQLQRKKNPLKAAIKKAAKEQGVKLNLSKGEETLAGHLNQRGIKYVREYKFHPTRKWQFDFAFPALRIAVEVEGGAFGGGRHQRQRGFEADMFKYNAATKLGWLVFRYTTELVTNGVAIADIEETLLLWRHRRPSFGHVNSTKLGSI